MDLEQVETNFVQLDVGALGLDRDDALTRLREGGVGLSSTIHPTVIRAVTHLDVDDDDIERAIELRAGRAARLTGGYCERSERRSPVAATSREGAGGIADAAR